MILDTNALSASAEQDSGIVEVLSRADDLAIPVVALGEYRYGIAQSRHRMRYTQWLDSFVVDCRVLDITDHTTHHYAGISIELRRAGTPIPTHDLWIAALCRQHSLPVLSRDHHFDLVRGIQRLAW